jgi:hypothetical protein
VPVNGEGQFDYPETGWSTGRMRKFGDPADAAGAMADSPVVNTIEKLLKGQRKAQEVPYETTLSLDEERAFQKWKQQHAPNDSGMDYDLRGAFKAGLKPDPKTGHWPDLYKKPNHPTFSDQSIYAKDRPDLAGRWEGETYIPPSPASRRSEAGSMKVAKARGGYERATERAQDWIGEYHDRSHGQERLS